jgi:hypothetical protein
VVLFGLVRQFVEPLIPDDPLAHGLSVEELERIRELIRGSVDRTQAELDRIEMLIVAANLREQKRAHRGSIEGELAHGVGFETPTDLE